MLIISGYLKIETDKVFKFYLNNSFTLKQAPPSNKCHNFNNLSCCCCSETPCFRFETYIGHQPLNHPQKHFPKCRPLSVQFHPRLVW